MNEATVRLLVWILSVISIGIPFALTAFVTRTKMIGRANFGLGCAVLFIAASIVPYSVWVALVIYGALAGCRANSMLTSNKWKLAYTFMPGLLFLFWPMLAFQTTERSLPRLHLAAASHRRDILKSELKGVDVNLRDRYQATALMYAAQKGDNEIVQLLIDAGADVGATAPKLGTAADLARKFGFLELADRLTERVQSAA